MPGPKVTVIGAGSFFFGKPVIHKFATSPIMAGDTLALFNASAFAGDFQTVDLPALPAGLTWDTSDLASNGTVTAISPLPPGASQFQTTLSFPSYNSNETLTNIALLVILGPGVPDFNDVTEALGQKLFYPPTVAGWAPSTSPRWQWWPVRNRPRS